MLVLLFETWARAAFVLVDQLVLDVAVVEGTYADLVESADQEGRNNWVADHKEGSQAQDRMLPEVDHILDRTVRVEEEGRSRHIDPEEDSFATDGMENPPDLKGGLGE